MLVHQNRQKSKLDFLVISHQNTCYQVWLFIMILLSLVSSYQYAYVATFYDKMTFE